MLGTSYFLKTNLSYTQKLVPTKHKNWPIRKNFVPHGNPSPEYTLLKSVSVIDEVPDSVI